jgi:hypothetical protein
MRPVALALSALLLAGCFPTNSRARTISKYSEGGLVLGGLVVEGLTYSITNCTMPGPGESGGTCSPKTPWLGDVGLAMILGGIIGFVATITTEPEAKTAPTVDIKAERDKLPTPKLPGSAAGGGDSSTSATNAAATPSPTVAPVVAPAAH